MASIPGAYVHPIEPKPVTQRVGMHTTMLGLHWRTHRKATSSLHEVNRDVDSLAPRHKVVDFACLSACRGVFDFFSA